MENLWILVAILLVVPSVVVGVLRYGLRREPSVVSGWGGVLFSVMALAAALWIIVERVS